MNSNIFPTISFHNSVNAWTGDIENFSERSKGFFSRCVCLSYFYHLMLIQFGCGRIYANQRNSSILAIHIVHIVLLRSGSNVIWITATWVSNARMKGEKIFRKISSIFNNPTDSMRPERVRLSWVARLYANCPVSVWLAISRPVPTLIRSSLFNLGPKSLFEIIRKYSRENLWWDRFAMHSVSLLIVCQALGCINSARALFL